MWLVALKSKAAGFATGASFAQPTTLKGVVVCFSFGVTKMFKCFRRSWCAAWIGTGMLVIAAGVMTGCNRSGTDEQAGGPGADIRGDDDQEPQDPARIFTASLGEETVELAVGQEKELTLSIERGEEFTQKVVAFVKAPRGISAVPDEMGFALGQQEGKILLTPTSDALVGDELAVEVEFKPETGASVRKQLLVTVIESQ